MAEANFSNDATSVVKAIQDGVETQIINVGGNDFVTRPVFLVPEKPNAAALDISTLDGLVEYLTENVDSHNFTDLVIIVNNPRSVSVRRQIEGVKENRVTWLEADYDVDNFPFDHFIDHGQFMVAAQSRIVDTQDRANLLKFIGNLTTAQISTSTDDGVSQSVVVESGVRKTSVELPNPVNLAPRRTFPEVAQPASPFVLRVRQSREGQMPELALYEADGGLWKTEAIGHIKKYIKTKLESQDILIPVIG